MSTLARQVPCKPQGGIVKWQYSADIRKDSRACPGDGLYSVKGGVAPPASGSGVHQYQAGTKVALQLPWAGLRPTNLLFGFHRVAASGDRPAD